MIQNNIVFDEARVMGPEQGSFEVVERKGLGHPDTLVDGIAEQVAIDYAQWCLKEFGVVPHHNYDKVYVRGGMVHQGYGWSDVVEPVDLYIGGRASTEFRGIHIPVEDLQRQAASAYIARILPHLNTQDPRHLRINSLTTARSHNEYWFKPRDEKDLPELTTPFSNDTAVMIGCWPLTPVENMTLALEGYFYELNEDGLPVPRFPHMGQDIKAMCVRQGNRVDSTMCIPQVADLTPDADTYQERLQAIIQDLTAYIAPFAEKHGLQVNLKVNTRDGMKSVSPYMLSIGSCLEAGEEGMVGRGNKSHGIISTMRPNSMEAPHGKNPMYFNGKVHGYISEIAARRIAEEFGCSARVVIQANNGEPLFDPAQILISTSRKVDQKRSSAIVEEIFSERSGVTRRILQERYFLPKALVSIESL